MDIPATLAENMGGWENLARALHSLFLDGVPTKRGASTHYDERWFYRVLLILAGNARGYGGEKAVTEVLREHIADLHSRDKKFRTDAARQSAAQSVQKQFSRLRKKHDKLFSSPIQVAVDA